MKTMNEQYPKVQITKQNARVRSDAPISDSSEEVPVKLALEEIEKYSYELRESLKALRNAIQDQDSEEGNAIVPARSGMYGKTQNIRELLQACARSVSEIRSYLIG